MAPEQRPREQVGPRVFLTGATGFIGRPLAQALHESGWRLTALVPAAEGSSPAAQQLRAMGADVCIGDVTERESMRSAMQGADLMIHNAGYYEFGVNAAGRRRLHAVNVEGTANVLSLARELAIPRNLYVSSVWALGRSGPEARTETDQRQAPYNSAYEQTKTEAHQLALDHQRRGLPLVIVCPNGVVGPNDHSAFGYLLRLHINGLLPPLAWAPGSVLSLVDLRDLVAGIVLAAEKGELGATYFLCGEACSLKEHVGFWRQRPGGAAIRLWLPTWLASLLCWPLEPLQHALGLPAVFSRESVRAGASHLYYSAEKAKRELGWRHRTAREMWLHALDGELTLRARRPSHNRLARIPRFQEPPSVEPEAAATAHPASRP